MTIKRYWIDEKMLKVMQKDRDYEDIALIKLSDLKKEIEKLQNPYPVDIFTEPTKYEMNLLRIFCIDNKITQDKLFGSFGRRVWNNCKEKFKKNLIGE